MLPKLAIAQDAKTATPADNFELKVAIDNPICDKKGGTGCTTTIKDLIAKILKVVIEFAIPVIIVMVIYSGFLYVVARGKPEAIETAHKTLTWTLIGAAIILGAQLISNVIIDTVSNISKDSGVSNSSITNNNNLVNSGSNAGVVNNVNNSNGTATAGAVLNNNTTTGVGTGNTTTNGTNTGTVVDPNTQKDVAKEPTNSQGDSVKTDPVVTPPADNSPVAGTLKQYYVNALNGANLRSDPSTASSANIITKNAYGTVLNVSGETSGFWNIFKSDKTFLGYTSKSLLTAGSQAPASNNNTSSGTTSGNFPLITKDAITPNPYTANLTFSKISEKAGSVTGKFGWDVNKSFTPYNGVLFVQCKIIGGDGTIGPNILEKNSNKSLTADTGYTSPTYTIPGSGTQSCIMYHYKDITTSKVYVTNEVKIIIK